MEKPETVKKRILKKLNGQIKTLQGELVVAKKVEGIDDYIAVKIMKSQARFEKIKEKGKEDKGIGEFFIQIDITAKTKDVYIPISVASGKKPAGFMYQIEGTAEGLISTANVKCKGDGVTQVTLGTLLFSRIPPGATATFRVQAEIKGKFGKVYKIVISRINYKLSLADVRYTQYLKPIVSDSVKFS